MIGCPPMHFVPGLRTSLLLSVCLAPALGLGAGCANVPTFQQYGPDAAIECGSEGLSCPSGEVCLEGHCYASCTTTSCGPRESCVGGICIPLAGDAGVDGGRDAPPQDTPPDPCIGVTCTAPTAVCLGGSCVACTLTEGVCGAAAPICLVARNTCVAFGGGTSCQPCNMDVDCTGGATCEVLGVAAPERVCLLPCGAGGVCGSGTVCDTTLNVCRPASGGTCYQQLAAQTGLTCTTDAECAPNGANADEGLFTGSCSGTCRFPCGVGTDCLSGVCNVSGYCQ
jgi:hypothetical protein